MPRAAPSPARPLSAAIPSVRPPRRSAAAGASAAVHILRGMFELTVETTFAAAHAIVIAGVREPVHGHNWHVTSTVAGPALDHEGLLVDFHAVQAHLDAITAPFRNADLNATPPFDRINPTAENVAVHIARTLADRLASASPNAPPAAHVAAVRVTEAPGCAVTYRPPAPPASPSPSHLSTPAPGRSGT